MMTRRDIFKGHIVHCKDLDNLAEFNVEVQINEKLDESAMINAAEDAAAKTEQATMSGNTIEFEYIQPSGRITEKKVTIERTELSPISVEAQALLDDWTLD